jgi:hypothetical protein
MDKVKSSEKTTVTVPQDYHSFVYQLRAFAHASSFFFGNESILAIQLKDFVANIKGRHSITYKNRITADNTFATKILWAVDSFVQLFLEGCRKGANREDVNQGVIDLDALNLDVIMFRFDADLPRSFHIKEENAKENDNPSNTSSTDSNNGKGKRKGTKKKKSSNKKIKNDDHIAEFKMADSETWEKTFQEKCPDSRVKFMGTYMCLCFHMKGECWSEGCNYKKSHVPAANIPDIKKQGYIEYMAECRRKSSIK